MHMSCWRTVRGAVEERLRKCNGRENVGQDVADKHASEGVQRAVGVSSVVEETKPETSSNAAVVVPSPSFASANAKIVQVDDGRPAGSETTTAATVPAFNKSAGDKSDVYEHGSATAATAHVNDNGSATTKPRSSAGGDGNVITALGTRDRVF